MSETVGAAPVAAIGPIRAGWRRFSAHRGRLAALVLLLALAAAAVAGPALTPFPYDRIDKAGIWTPPLAGGHLLGADALGRDLLARLLMGLRVSLLVGLTATVVALAIGVVYGATAGLAGGAIDEAMMRLVDALYALPFIFFVILLTVAFGQSLWLILLAIGAVEWLTMARIVRGEARALSRRDFVQAARAIGVSELGVAIRHILPNLVGPVLAYVTLTVPNVILAESFLSFLGLGVQEPLTSLGLLVADGASQMEVAPWLLVFPAIAMSALLLCLNLVGDGIRAALDASGRAV